MRHFKPRLRGVALDHTEAVGSHMLGMLRIDNRELIAVSAELVIEVEEWPREHERSWLPWPVVVKQKEAKDAVPAWLQHASCLLEIVHRRIGQQMVEHGGREDNVERVSWVWKTVA